MFVLEPLSICFDFTSNNPNAQEFLYFVKKEGDKDCFYFMGSTIEIQNVKYLDVLLDVKSMYKRYVVDWKKRTKKAENAYKKDIRKNERLASTYNLETARKNLNLWNKNTTTFKPRCHAACKKDW